MRTKSSFFAGGARGGGRREGGRAGSSSSPLSSCSPMIQLRHLINAFSMSTLLKLQSAPALRSSKLLIFVTSHAKTLYNYFILCIIVCFLPIEYIPR